MNGISYTIDALAGLLRVKIWQLERALTPEQQSTNIIHDDEIPEIVEYLRMFGWGPKGSRYP